MPDEAYCEVRIGGPRAKRRGVALVDRADAEAVGAHSWYMDDKGYAARNLPRGEGKRLKVRMHRFLLGLGAGDPRQGDHVDGNKLDNRRANLRVCTNAQNQQNQHERPSRGTHRDARCNRWQAQVQLDGKKNHVGSFATQEEAAAAAAAFRRANMPYSSDARAEP